MRKIAFLVVPIVFLSSSLFASVAYVELPFVLATRFTPALSTDLRPGFGVGFTQYVWNYRSIHLGVGALLSLSPHFWQGTKEVYSVGLENDLEGRAYLAYAIDGSNISFWPYLFVAPNVGMKFAKISAYASNEWVVDGDLGIRSGIGIQVRFREMAIKLDTSAGTTFAGLNLRTWIMLGFGIF